MALLILDDCSIGIGPNPEGGFLVKLTNIAGFPEGLDVLIPFQNGEWAYEQIRVAMSRSPKIETASPTQMRREVDGLHPTE